MSEKWIVVTSTTHWGPFDSVAEAGEFLSEAASHFPAPQYIVLLKNYADMLIAKALRRAK